jgi:integrase
MAMYDNTLIPLFHQYLNEARFSACLRPETLRGYKAVFDLFIKIMPEVTGCELLTPGMLNEFFRRIQTRQRIVGKNTLKTGVKKSTIKTLWAKLNVFLKWLERKSIITTNPLREIKAPRVSYNDFRRLEDGDIHRIYSAISRSSQSVLLMRRDIAIISLLLYCGLRRGELVSLRIPDIDLHRKEITVRGETSKSKFTRVLKLHPTLVMHIKEYLNERNRQFKKTEKLIVSYHGDFGLTKDGLHHWVKRLITKSGVRFHLHQLRHTFACKLAEQNVNLFKIQKLMGHSNILMTMKYARSMRSEDMAEDIDKIAI